MIVRKYASNNPHSANYYHKARINEAGTFPKNFWVMFYILFYGCGFGVTLGWVLAAFFKLI